MLPLQTRSIALKELQLLLCMLYTLSVSVTASSIKKGQPVNLALNSNPRDSWNISGPLSNDSDVGVGAGFTPSLNATGENSVSRLNTSLEPFFEPSFDTYKNVSVLLKRSLRPRRRWS